MATFDQNACQHQKLYINFMMVQIYGFYIKWIFTDVKC